MVKLITNSNFTLVQLPELGGEGGKCFQCGKCVWPCYGPASRWTQSNHEELPAKLWVAPKPVRGIANDKRGLGFILA